MSVKVNREALETVLNMLHFMSADGYTPRADVVAEMAIETYLSYSQSVVTVEDWNSLPINTMARVHYEGDSEIVVRCPDGSGAGIGRMSFFGGEFWEHIYTDWGASKIEVLFNPAVNVGTSANLFDAWEAGATYGHNTEGRLIDKLEKNPYPNPDQQEETDV